MLKIFIDFASTLLKDFATKITASSFGAVYAYMFNPDLSNFLVALVFLILFDFITGVMAAKKTGIKVESHKVRRSAIKMGFYALMISSCHFADVVTGSAMILEKSVLVFLSMTELLSIFENGERMGYQMPTQIIKKIKDVIGGKKVPSEETKAISKKNTVRKVSKKKAVM